jgi:prevent-host-death family protein
MANDYATQLRAHLRGMKAVTASEAKNQFGQVLETALRDGAVVITKHDAPKAILLSLEEYEAMATTRTRLDALGTQWDAMYAEMQRPGARGAMTAAFHATPKQLGAAAVKAARKKR